MKIGEIVYSKAGRDKGRYFVVTNCFDNLFVDICDGKLRKSDRPKRKKIRHLDGKGVVIQTLAEKLESGITLTNPEIRRALAEFEAEVSDLAENDKNDAAEGGR